MSNLLGRNPSNDNMPSVYKYLSQVNLWRKNKNLNFLPLVIHGMLTELLSTAPISQGHFSSSLLLLRIVKRNCYLKVFSFMHYQCIKWKEAWNCSKVRKKYDNKQPSKITSRGEWNTMQRSMTVSGSPFLKAKLFRSLWFPILKRVSQ